MTSYKALSVILEHINFYGEKKVSICWYLRDLRSDPRPINDPDPHQTDADPHHCWETLTESKVSCRNIEGQL